MNKQNTADFSQGSVGSRIMAQAIPLTLAEIVQLLYNIVDRVFLGHLPDGNTLALTGVGLIFPIVSIVAAFTSLYSSGGAPIFAMARGRKDEPRALQIQGTVYSLLLVSSLALMVLCYAVKRPLLFLFGASEDSFVYADEYLKVYLLGTPFTMLATGLNPFINAQGRPKVGMMTTVLGAAMNLVLDPLFIYVFHMGVTGAAVATVISQAVSCIWVLRFLSGPKAILPLQIRQVHVCTDLLKDILSLGVVGFIMKFTNSLVQVACNKMLSIYGGDLYVGVMTVINSIREVFTLPVSGVTEGARPVLSYNYGARQMKRVRDGIWFMVRRGHALYLLRMAVFDVPAADFVRAVYAGWSAGRGQRENAPRVFCGLLLPELSVLRAERFSIAGLGEACHHVFAAAQGGHRRAADAAAADDGLWHDGRVSGRAGFQHCRRSGLLHHHALHCLSKTGAGGVNAFPLTG